MAAERTPSLNIGLTDLSIGEYSVGLAPSRTGDQLLDAYLELIALVRADHPDDVRRDDLAVLVEATGMERSFVETRTRLQLESS